ncbi:MAG: T9SS type A sorting domain-containing protein [Paludibacteraceae bacterium]|nr:T9SS type A sorting domain-containing protein [Paludibacteraceae bacterium]
MKTLYKMNNVCKRVSAMGKALALAVVMLAFGNSAYAWQIEAGDVYFDNTVTKWSQVYIRFGTTTWCTVYKMEKVADNDNIYYFNFQGTADGIEAIQFASVDGYNVTDPSQCFDQCGIYNGNVISDGQKTDYVRADLSGSNRCVVAIGNTGYCAYSGPQPMPGSVSYNLTKLGGSTVTKGGIVGYFTPGQSVAFAGSTDLGGYPQFPAGVGDYVHATFRYYLSGSTYSNISCSGTNNSAKSFSTQVTLPSAPGKYTMSTYYRCGGIDSETYTSYYHIVGLTGNDLNFGALQAGAKKSLTESLSGVWNGYAETAVTAEISGAGASNFSFSEDASTQSTSIAITNKAGSTPIYFTAPSEKGNYTATLTLTLTYNTSQTITKTYTLTGSVVPDEPTVMLGAAPVCLDGPKATLSGYLKLAACNNDLKEAGIVWSTGANPEVGKSGCTTIQCITGDTPIEVGTAWSGNTATKFTAGQTYYYRAYVIDKSTSGGTYYSPDGTFMCSSACVYPEVNDTVYIQVDKNFEADDDCALKYRELQTAVTKIKSIGYLYNLSSKILNKHIVVLVGYHKTPYTGTGTTSVTGGEATDLSTIIFEDINNTQTPEKVLVIRAANPAQSPIIQHPTIRNSKNITFENVNIHGSESAGATSTQFDNAVDIDSGDTNWMGLTTGAVANANINFKNCEIKSKGFTCLHAAAYDGITFENCDIKAELDPSMLGNANTNKWGASVKFIRCKNIKFLRNNFRGSHATSVWLQGVIGFLAMNNVFWNDNNAYNSSYKENGTFFRLVTQQSGSGATADLNQKIGIYYNTLYIADNDAVTDDRHFDFFRLGSNYEDLQKVNLGQNEASTIRFLYNNCYSYDTSSVIGCNQSGDNKWCLTATESDWCSSIHHNNYWSMNEGRTPYFVIPNESACGGNVYYNVNVYEQVCSTAASDPATLVIKGGDLNLGQHITSDESGLGGETLYNDRLHASNGADAVRKTNGKWTIGAYQQSEASTPVDVIVWWGDVKNDSTNWDNRYNWRKLDGSRVTCVDNFAADLKVIIPAPESETYKTPDGGIKNYPNLPAKFDGTRTKNTQETVNAGHGISNPSKFAGTIELEYGGAIKNVEALNDDEARRYTEANTSFTAGRKEWILVGTVVRPFADGGKQSVRLVQSGDYFIADHMPHVYMHEASFNKSTAEAGWLTPFTQLDQEVPYDRVFAIKIPDQYGPYKLPAAAYAQYFGIGDPEDGTRSKTFNFNGWFLNDEVIPEYKIDGNKIMSNTYPATLSVEAAIGVNHGEFKVYDYSEQSFESEVDYIKPQNGFIFVPVDGNDGYFRITPEMLTSENTKYKSATATNPTLKLRASNPAGTDGSSSVLIIYDELKSDEYVQGPDLINTTIAGMPTKPEVYAMMFGKELDKATVPSLEQAIPLGLKLEKAMTVEFTLPTMEGIEKAILEDREANKSYDLLKGEKGSISLAAGTYAGRFYLNLGAEEQDIPTEDDDVTTSTATIDLYGNGKNIIISSSENVILKSAEITDMSGRTTVVDLKNAHYNKIKVKGAQGVYVVKAIGDTKTETAKVIVK